MVENLSFLPVLWFILIAVLWTGYLFLEGFDLGVGMLMKTLGRSNTESRVLLNTIGPVWDGNEVWIITAIGAMFAAFPLWYAGLLAGMYIPMLVVLLGLILRACSIEYRGKVSDLRWQKTVDWCIGVGSFLAAFGIGALLGVTSTGLPLDANGDRIGGPLAWVSPWAILGGVSVVVWCIVHGAAFTALKTDGDIRHRARKLAWAILPLGALLMLFWAVVVGTGLAHERGHYGWQMPVFLVLLIVAVAAAAAAWFALRAGREGWGFLALAVFLVVTAANIFASMFPVVLPATGGAENDLTVISAASGSYSLALMSVVALVGVPLVLVYQGWTYWVFRKRISAAHLPADPSGSQTPAAHRA